MRHTGMPRLSLPSRVVLVVRGSVRVLVRGGVCSALLLDLVVFLHLAAAHLHLPWLSSFGLVIALAQAVIHAWVHGWMPRGLRLLGRLAVAAEAIAGRLTLMNWGTGKEVQR